MKNRGDLVIGSDETEIDRELKKLKADVSLEELEGPRLMGIPSQIISKIEEYLKLGVDYFVVLASSRSNQDLIDIGRMKLFGEKVRASFT